MKLKVNNVSLDPIRVRDRLEFRFDSGSNLDYITLEGSDIFGDIQLSEIQLEQSTVSTPFVEPMESETVASGLFKTVQGISYEITSPDSDTWAQIKQSVEGSITTYHNGPLKSTLALTVNDVIFGIRDIVSGDQASFNLRLEGIQQVVKDEMFESVQTQLSNFVGIELQDIEGNINTIQNTVDGSVQQISDLEGSFNTMQDTVDGSIQRIGNVEGDLNTVQTTASSNVQAITDLTGQHNTTRNTVNSMSQVIGTQGEKIAQIVMSDSIFKVNVINEIDNAKSSVNVLSDSIGLRSAGNTIHIGGEGILIDAESIFLGSSTQIKDGIITDRLIASSAEIDGAKIANATISDAKITTLDVDKISGEISEFVESYWNSAVGGGVSISAYTGVRTRATSGEESRLEDGGIKLYDRAGSFTGKFDSSYTLEGYGGVGIFVRANNHFSIVREGGTLANPTYTPIMYLRGGSNNMRMNTNLSMIGNNIVDVQTLRFTGGNAAVRRQASNNVEITTHGEDNRAVLFGQTTAQFGRSIDMNGNTITNQSDIRLKTKIKESSLRALDEIDRLEFIDYYWDKSKNINKGKPDGPQFGIKAQYARFLQTKAGESDSYLSIDMNKQVHMNSKGIQELYRYVKELERRLYDDAKSV